MRWWLFGIAIVGAAAGALYAARQRAQQEADEAAREERRRRQTDALIARLGSLESTLRGGLGQPIAEAAPRA